MGTTSTILYYIVIPVLLACVLWLVVERDASELLCRTNYSDNEQVVCRMRCAAGEFSLPGMTECRKWLTCKDIESADFKVFEGLDGGAVKNVRWYMCQGA